MKGGNIIISLLIKAHWITKKVNDPPEEAVLWLEIDCCCTTTYSMMYDQKVYLNMNFIFETCFIQQFYLPSFLYILPCIQSGFLSSLLPANGGWPFDTTSTYKQHLISEMVQGTEMSI